MIKDVMVRLDGSVADNVRLAAVNDIAEAFDSHITGLYINVVPFVAPVASRAAGPGHVTTPQQAREAGDELEKLLNERLARLQKPARLRRFDVYSDTSAYIAARAARAADVFVALRPDGALQESERLVESVLFGAGRHLFLVPPENACSLQFKRALVAWNGSRESARALAEALPYLHRAESVTVVGVIDEDQAALQADMGKDAVSHLEHHGIAATLHQVTNIAADVGITLMSEAQRREADFIVMGAYGHSRLREWLLGETTYELMHESPVPLLAAH